MYPTYLPGWERLAAEIDSALSRDKKINSDHLTLELCKKVGDAINIISEYKQNTDDKLKQRNFKKARAREALVLVAVTAIRLILDGDKIMDFSGSDS